ncbi:MAG TPA: hypothetical protein VFW59_03730, partial [Gallionella sp.]|nr:hypothetical protein [Gallionella sp.]
FWKTYIESRGITAVIAMTALACTIAIAPKPAEAAILHLGNYGEERHSHDLESRGIYIMRISEGGSLERFLARLLFLIQQMKN